MTPSESPSPLSEVLAFLQTAVAHHQQGHLAQAEDLYKKVLASSPEQADAWHLLGVLAYQCGKHQEALQLINRAIAIQPEQAVFYSSLGNVLRALNQTEEALRNYDRAIALNSSYAEAYSNRGSALQDLARYEEALGSYDRAIALKPDYPEAYSNRGALLHEMKRYAEALANYESAIRYKPDYAEAYYNRGNTLQPLRRFEEALASYEKAISLKPDYAEAYINRGNTLQLLQRFEESLTSYERGNALRPGLFEGYSNHGNALKELKQFDQALASYKRAIALKPDYAEAHWNHALCLLLLERYAEGWKQYEWRWKYKGFTSPLRHFKQPLWLGEQDVSGKTVLLHAEQGLGDTIQFARYAKLVRALGARVILEVPKALIPLMRSLEGADELVEKDQPLPHFDLHCPLLSLPLAFKTDAASIPAQVPYLSVSEERIERWRRHIGTAGLKIAICWQGSPNGKIDIGRSFPVALFENISKIPGVRLISLQKGAGTEQLQNLPTGMRVETLPPGFDEGEGAFLDSAAVMGCVDLVITSDTALTHLAGALGVKSWLPLKYVPDWRWLMERSDSPWYPNHRLFRQPQRDDWLSVFAAIELELRKLLAPTGAERVSSDAVMLPAEVAAALQAAVAHHQQGHLAQAEELYKNVLAASPEQADAWHLLGVLAYQCGKHEEAVALIDKAISIYPREASYYSNRGLALKQLNRLEDALASYDYAVALKPDYVDAHYYRGVVLQRLGRSEDALASYEAVVRLRPDHAEAFSNRGAALQDLKRFEEALASYQQAIVLKPDYAEAHCNRGVVLQELNRFEEALASHNQAIALKPDYPEAYYNRGNTLQKLQRFEEALKSYEQTIRIRSDHAEARYNRGLVFQNLKQFEGALASYEQAIAIDENYADAYYNRGLVFQNLKQFEGALASYEQAIAIDANYADAYYNRGLAFQELKQFDQALASYKRAIALKPDYAEAHWNHALCLLLLERYAEGWKQYEWRWKYKGFTSPLRHFKQPLWLGEQDVWGKTVLLHAEQGLGDTIQFARYAKLVRALGARVILEVPKALIPLMRSLEGADELVEKDQPLPHFDLHCPLLSLPLAFKTDAASIPAQVPYLRVSEERIERWRRHIGTAGFKIAICWQGSPNGKIDIGRSFPVALFENISKIPGVRLISLQKGAGTEQLQNLPAGMRVEPLPPGFDEGEGAFLDSAAVMGCVDLVITSDTALTHLAGALGVKSWLPLKYVPDWRWLMERSDSPWYPNHRLFRQPQRDDWRSVFAAMELELRKCQRN